MQTSFAIWLPSANCLPSACQLESGLNCAVHSFSAWKQMAVAICVCQLANCVKAKLHKGFVQLASWQISPYSYGVTLSLPPSRRQHSSGTPPITTEKEHAYEQ